MAIPTENNGQPSANQNPNKRRGKKSIVWEHFTLEPINDECTRACCNQCKKSFSYITGSKIAGTSHLKRHIALGICPVNRHKSQEKSQPAPYNTYIKNDGDAHTNVPEKRSKNYPKSEYLGIDQDCCRHEFAKMIVLHEYPLNIVEHSGFVGFLQTLQPQFCMVNVNTIQGECVKIYEREKQRLLRLLHGISGRVNLALDLWTSNQGLGYVILTGYFVDSDWRLRRRILNVVMLSFPDSEIAFTRAVVECITNWGLENKLFTLTLDQCFASEAVRRNLRGLLPIKKNSHILKGQLLLGNCYARVLNCLAKDALSSTREIVNKIRSTVKYVKTFEGNEEQYIELKQQLQNPSTKSLIVDDETKWDTTYHMLDAAFEWKEVFSCFDTTDPNYKETPSTEEWRRVEILCIYLKLLFDAANILIAPTYPTTNVFFHEVWKIQLELKHAAMSQDVFISNLTRPLQERFEEYWMECNLVLAVAVILDPRCKMKLVDISFSEIYGEDAEIWIEIVNEGMKKLFVDYLELSLLPPSFAVEESEREEKEEPLLMLEMNEGHVDFSGFDVYLSDKGVDVDVDVDVFLSEDMLSIQPMQSELDQYMEEPLLCRQQDFDVLAWWKLNTRKYPTLSKMASDILCIPVSTLAADSVFDTRSKRMDGYHSSLSPSVVEALICAKDWLLEISSETPTVEDEF